MVHNTGGEFNPVFRFIFREFGKVERGHLVRNAESSNAFGCRKSI